MFANRTVDGASAKPMWREPYVTPAKSGPSVSQHLIRMDARTAPVTTTAPRAATSRTAAAPARQTQPRHTAVSVGLGIMMRVQPGVLMTASFASVTQLALSQDRCVTRTPDSAPVNLMCKVG